MPIIPFLKSLDLSNDDKVKLSSLIEDRIKLETNWVKNPFELKDDMWFMNKETREKHFPTFPSGGYKTEKQARMALTIHQISTSLNYEEIELLSGVFKNGIL
jgi:hypothetical protein